MLERIFITGKSGAGKTTMGEFLERELQREVHFSDMWEAELRSPEMTRQENVSRFAERAREVAESPSWIVESGVHHYFETFLTKADAVILLDVPAITAVHNIAKRTVSRKYSDRDGEKSIGREAHNVLAAAAVYPTIRSNAIFELLAQNAAEPIFVPLRRNRDIKQFKGEIADSLPDEVDGIFESYSQPIPSAKDLSWGGRVIKQVLENMGRGTHHSK